MFSIPLHWLVLSCFVCFGSSRYCLCPSGSPNLHRGNMILMLTSSNGNVTGPLCGEFTGHRWILHKRPVTRSIDSLNCAWMNNWVNNRGAGDLIRHRAHYDIIVKPGANEKRIGMSLNGSHWTTKNQELITLYMLSNIFCGTLIIYITGTRGNS